ncbi:hypothetical protein GRJ2_001207400 [Grus japonensis]|uniref:Uncharacterized protein n=1 Tax=Grus japonensis TaxID=30415 RepID=A0ABC9WPQ0_GRUJA
MTPILTYRPSKPKGLRSENQHTKGDVSNRFNHHITNIGQLKITKPVHFQFFRKRKNRRQQLSMTRKEEGDSRCHEETSSRSMMSIIIKEEVMINPEYGQACAHITREAVLGMIVAHTKKMYLDLLQRRRSHRLPERNNTEPSF